jgi:putative chitinase
MSLDAPTLASCTGATLMNATKFMQPINFAMQLYEINTPERQAAFLAQIGEESGSLVYTTELWGPTEAQKEYEPPSSMATHLGNTEPGDGFKFRGRGLIQITGRANYAAVGQALCLDCTNKPDLLAEPDWAAESAAWWWNTHGLNELADGGNFPQITRVINGALTGEAQRESLWSRAKEALGVV